jgi:hypothetical protein
VPGNIETDAGNPKRLIVNNPSGTLVSGDVDTNDFIRIIPAVPDYVNFYYPICKVDHVLLNGASQITDIYLDYEMPAAGALPSPDTRSVWRPTNPLFGLKIVGFYDDDLGVHLCDVEWQMITPTHLTDWPGDFPNLTMIYIDGIAQNHDAGLYDINDEGVTYTDISFPPTYYGWELKIEYLDRARIDLFVKRVIAATPNVIISGEPSTPELSVILETETILDKTGNTAVKNFTVDPVTGKVTIVRREVVGKIIAGAGIEITQESGPVTINSITSEAQTAFVIPIRCTGTEVIKDNGIICYDMTIGSEAWFMINVPRGNLNTKYDTVIYFVANFTESDENFPLIGLSYNIAGRGTNDDNKVDVNPSIDTNTMSIVNAINEVEALTLANSILVNKTFIAVKMIRNPDSYKGQIYLSGLKVNFYS